jgi:hypothetical protein
MCTVLLPPGVNPIAVKYIILCLLRVLCTVWRPLTTLDRVLLNDKNLVLTMTRNHLWMSTAKIPPYYHMLVIYAAFYLFPYILPGDPQCRIWSNKMANSPILCELVGQFHYPLTHNVPKIKKPRSMLDGNVIQRLLALLYQ